MIEGFMYNHYLADNENCRLRWNQNIDKDRREVTLVDV